MGGWKVGRVVGRVSWGGWKGGRVSGERVVGREGKWGEGGMWGEEGRDGG